jgi:HEAT repeat protein
VGVLHLFGLSKSDVAKMEAKRDIKGLVKALTYKKDPDVRKAAADALGKIGDAQAIDGLALALKDQDSRWLAEETLGKISSRLTAEELVIALKHQNTTVRSLAAETLGKIGDACAVDELIVALKDQDGSVSWKAAEALGRIGGESTVNKLLVALKDPTESGRRERAAKALGDIGDPKAVDALIEAFKDRNAALRSSEAVGRIGGESTVNKLLIALKDPDTAVRCMAANALGEIGDAHAVDALIATLKDQEFTVRGSFMCALGKIGGARAVDVLVNAIKDQDANVRGQAVEALGKSGDPKAVDALIDAALKDPGGNASQAASIIGNMYSEYAVSKLFRTKGRFVAETALGRIIRNGRGSIAPEIVDQELKGLFAYPIELKSYSEKHTPINRDWYDNKTKELFWYIVPLSSLSREVVQWAIDASTYEINTSDKYQNSGRGTTSFFVSNMAIGRLCNSNSPITSNILHLAAQKRDITLTYSEGCQEFGTETTYETSVSFQHQREEALNELKKRGNPPYQIEAYRKKL